MPASSALAMGSSLPASSGLSPVSGEDQRGHDERQRDDVGQQLLVEVGGHEHEQRREVDAQDAQVARLAPAAGEGGEGEPPRRRPERRSASHDARTAPPSWAGQRAARRSASDPTIRPSTA